MTTAQLVTAWVFIQILSPFVLGCGSMDGAKKPYSAKIITSTDNGYGIKTVTFDTLENIDQVDGRVAVIKGDASLNIDADIGEIVTSENPDAIYSSPGKAVQLDYVVESGVVVPRNFQSLAMLSIYYHYEQIFGFWEKNLDVTLEEFGKLRLFMNPRIEAKSPESTISGVIKINAAFLPGPRDFWFFKTSPLENVPINLNFGVLAHEFGHAVFDLAFAKKDAEFYDIGDEEKSEKLNGFNEGISDYFSWMVTGKLTEFGESLEILGKERVMPVSWTLKSLEKNGSGEICSGGFYCEGSLFSSALYEIANLEGRDPISVGKAVFQSLGDLREDWAAAQKGAEFGLDTIVNRIYSRLEGEDNAAVCEIFKKWFDVDSVKDKIACEE